MKVAVTGATGFIGRALIPELLARGHSVVALTRRPEAVSEAFTGKVELSLWTGAGVDRIPSCNAVVHLAGESVSGRWDEKKKSAIRDSRVLGTRSLVEAIGRLDPRPAALVSASAIGYYGDRADEILTEESGPGSDFLAGVCGAWEAEARRAADLGLRVAWVRMGIALDREGGALEQMAAPFKLGVGGRLGSGRQWLPWIHRADATGLFLHALERAVSGPMNGVAPEPVRNADFTRALAKALHRPALFPVPGFALKLVMGEFAEAVLGGQRALPKVAQETGYRFRFPTLADALEEIYG